MRNVLIVGSGKRVQEAALPAFLRAGEDFAVRGVLARTEKELRVEGRSFGVQRLVDLDQGTLDGTDLIYMVVAKNAVPEVLKTLRGFDVSSVDLLIDTPVLRFKHLGHLHLLDGFRRAFVPEDCTTLPVYDVLDRALAEGAIGELRRVHCERSAYAYHGIAMGRRLFGAGRVKRARQTRGAEGTLRREVHYAGGGVLEILAPRDYALGRVRLEGSAGSLGDGTSQPENRRLRAVVDQGACVGFRIGDTEALLTPAERELMGSPKDTPDPDPGVWVWMEGMKRVGFLRLLQRIARGEGAYPLEHAVEDTVVDYHLERLHRYRSNPFTSAHFPTARLLMRAVTRLAGG